MSTKRVLFLGACVALAAAGADARALLRDSGAVAADPADLACGACKKFVAQGEDYINDPSTLDQVGEEIKKLCEDQASEQAEMVRSAREGARARNARKRARDPRRARSSGSRHIRRHLVFTIRKRFFQGSCATTAVGGSRFGFFSFFGSVFGLVFPTTTPETRARSRRREDGRRSRTRATQRGGFPETIRVTRARFSNRSPDPIRTEICDPLFLSANN